MPAPSRTYASKIGLDVQMAKNAPKYTYVVVRIVEKNWTGGLFQR